MKICHVSDHHGNFKHLRGDFDVIVASGDMLPNYVPRCPQVEAQWQRDWVIGHATMLKQWAGGRPVLWCPGNHDFADVTPQLIEIGIDARSLKDQRQTVHGVTFYGFPYVPALGYWWHEYSDQMLSAATDAMDLNGVHVLVAHCPPRGVLDRAGRDCTGYQVPIGNKYLRDRFEYERPESVRLILCGHCHEEGGNRAMPWPGVTVVNSACRQTIVEV